MKSFDDSHGTIKKAAEALEKLIARAGHAAEDVIDQIRGGSTSSLFLLDLQKVIDDMDFVGRKTVNVQIWTS